ncbi:MAG: cytochrome c oxidase subunit II [Chloroflexi bacterium]|nr:cytochrome c oxidase subunit II [Chloroflexota bacterium]
MIHMDRSERNYLIGTLSLLVVFASIVMVSSFAYGIQLPTPVERVDPRTVADDPDSPWSAPAEERIRELAPGKYEVYVLAQIWKFSPGSTNYGEPPITVPTGSTVTFFVTSKDIQHGFRIDGTNVNMMIIPGEVSKLSATFDKPGEYNIVCHEYCGVNHHTMFGKIIVEP